MEMETKLARIPVIWKKRENKFDERPVARIT